MYVCIYSYSSSFDEPSVKWECCRIFYSIGVKVTGFHKITVIKYRTNYPQIKCSLLCREIIQPLYVAQNTENGLLYRFLFYCELWISNIMLLLHSYIHHIDQQMHSIKYWS